MDVAHKADAVAGAAAVVDEVTPQRLAGDGVQHMAVAVIQPDGLGNVDVALKRPGIEQPLVLGQLAQRVGAGDVGGAVQIGSAAVHQQKALALQNGVILRSGVVVHHGCVAAVGCNGAKALHKELIVCAAVLVQDLVHGQLGQLFAGSQTVFQFDLEPHHSHGVPQMGLAQVCQLHLVLHALHGQQGIGGVLHGQGGVVFQHLIHGVVHGSAFRQHGLRLGLGGHPVQNAVVVGQRHAVGFQLCLSLRGDPRLIDKQHGAVRGDIAVGHGVGGALDIHGAQVQKPCQIIQLAYQLGGAALLLQFAAQLLQLFRRGQASVLLGQDPCRGSRTGRAALHPQLILQEQGLDAAVLGLQFLFQVVDQCTVGGQAAQTQRAALGQHLAAVFLGGGHARLAHAHQLDLGAGDLLFCLHKVPAVCPDGALGHGDHKVGVLTVEAGEVGQGGVVVGQILAGMRVAHRDQIDVHAVCLHSGTQRGQTLGNCVHTHNKSPLSVICRKNVRRRWFAAAIVSFCGEECNAGAKLPPKRRQFAKKVTIFS